MKAQGSIRITKVDASSIDPSIYDYDNIIIISSLSDANSLAYGIGSLAMFVGDALVGFAGVFEENVVYQSTEARIVGTFNQSDWTPVLTKNKIVANINTTIEGLHEQLDSKIQTYYQDTYPYANQVNVSEDFGKNDYWYCTDTHDAEGVTYTAGDVYKYVESINGNNFDYTWTLTTDFSNSLFHLADGKRTIYSGDTVPENAQENDIWIPSSDVGGVTIDYDTVANVVLQIAVGLSSTGVLYDFLDEVLPSGFKRADLNESGAVTSADGIDVLEVKNGTITSGTIYDNFINNIQIPYIALYEADPSTYSEGISDVAAYTQGEVYQYVNNVWVATTKYTEDLNTFVDEINPRVATLENQTDGKIEYYFYESYTDLSAADEAEALSTISSIWALSEQTEASNGNVVYFKDSTNAYWYQSSTDTWLSIDDTSIYEALQTAAGKMSVYFAIEVSTDSNPGSIDNITNWFYNGTLKKISDNSVITPNKGDELKTVVIDGDQKDYYYYTYTAKNWALNTPDGLVAKSNWAVNLDAYIGEYNGAVSTLTNDIETTSDGRIKAAFEYGNTIEVDGVSYNSGFGLKNWAEGTATSSDFWIDADRFRLVSQSAYVDGDDPSSPFTVTRDANGNHLTQFTGAVVFSSNGTDIPLTSDYINQTAINAVSQVELGDKNINITDNLIPTDSLLFDTNNAGYQLEGDPTKTTTTAIEGFSETVVVLDLDDEVYSPYLDEPMYAYYYRFAITGVTSLIAFNIVSIDTTYDLDENVVGSTSSVQVVSTNVASDGTGDSVTLDNTKWYIVDGIINPKGVSNTEWNGSIRTVDGSRVGYIQNISMDAQVGVSGNPNDWLILGWVNDCTIARMKLAKITADTATGSTASTDYVDSNTVPVGGAAEDINSNTTTVSGSKIRTGVIYDTSWDGVEGSNNYKMKISLDNGYIHIKNEV